jgi:benzoyl-CoA reductase/2-hydroxyglutaryl-CoA dehydratase subunit BcrC/BadD/HgdB
VTGEEIQPRGHPGGQRIGFTCAYAPLVLIDAAGFTPYRILPLGEAPDRAGSILHDNMCPHVKRVLDRGLAGDLPELAGLVVMNSCDAMRRLADAWQSVRPADRISLVDLPTTDDDRSVAYLARELARLAEQLSSWAGRPVEGEGIVASAHRHRQLVAGLARVEERAARGALPGGRRRLQELLNRSVTEPLEDFLEELRRLEEGSDPAVGDCGAIPLFLFGNVLVDPAAFELFEECGARVVGDDLCTGARQTTALQIDDPERAFQQLAQGLLARPLCARTLSSRRRDGLAEQVVSGARACGARGVVAHVMKFCDPYLGRLPELRRQLEKAGLPLLILEGDCTLRSLGQHATRIEAFVEMLGEGAA